MKPQKMNANISLETANQATIKPAQILTTLTQFIFQIAVLFACSINSLYAQSIKQQASAVLKKQVLEEAAWALKQEPITVTASSSPLSAGGKNDFFSQADYFWPNPANPTGPYINRDGESNPANFVEHRKVMIRFSTIMGALASAYQLTGDQKYVKHALRHLKAWFINPETRMNPNLAYAQAVIGVTTGRSWGIIDTIHLMEVAQGTIVMEKSSAFDKSILNDTKKWFADYILWLNTSKNGIAEKLSQNNHSTCWAMQVASFAKLTQDEAMLDSLRWRYKQVLLPKQMAADGSFPLELRRTKPYGYSLFNLDAFVTLIQILSSTKDDLWLYKAGEQQDMLKGIQYLYPFVADKSKWTLKPDVMFWDYWPVAHPFLIFGAQRYNNAEWFSLWKKLDHLPKNEEVIRNLPIRHPLIWM